ncbi:MAG TPA: hypothetical protein H9810_07750 [Candidatus Gemmiger excrementavium]|uniref:Uncharacterized protein n=1 Tax=Candidatus Gemmiger excrementavium TaxID=2838608 RepID=A0A9D2JGD9_9FIRM|nr:hypothetical protein [Candidatus Gemmiger excrementavium]
MNRIGINRNARLANLAVVHFVVEVDANRFLGSNRLQTNINPAVIDDQITGNSRLIAGGNLDQADIDTGGIRSDGDRSFFNLAVVHFVVEVDINRFIGSNRFQLNVNPTIVDLDVADVDDFVAFRNIRQHGSVDTGRFKGNRNTAINIAGFLSLYLDDIVDLDFLGSRGLNLLDLDIECAALFGSQVLRNIDRFEARRGLQAQIRCFN